MIHLLLLTLLFLRPSSTFAENITPESLKPELECMLRMKVIQGSAYWEQHAVTGGSCDGKEVQTLLQRIAQILDPARGAEHPLETLMERKVIWNDYWAKNAVPGQQCNGEYVATLIRVAGEALGDVELIQRYPRSSGMIAQPLSSAFSLAYASNQPPSFNTIIGTQTFGAAYRFTSKSRLLETAEAIRAMGSNVIKFELSSRYAEKNGNVDTPLSGIHSLTELARDEPSHRMVLEMPFAHFVLWANTFCEGTSKWQHGFAKSDQDAEYRELYDFTRYLLTAYNGSGKTFYLGHWEGDGYLRGSVARENDAKVTPVAVQGMIDWLNTRQRAVEDARRDTPHSGVQVWNYTEVNHVKLAMQGRPALVNRVLPKTNVDLVSYSSYDTQANPELLKRALSYIESQMPPKPGITGRRVFIGEYGFPAIQNSPEEQDRQSRRVMQAGLEWGCPFILYWEIYNNEVEPEGKQRGFWLIDDKGVKQPIYETHRQYLTWVQDFLKETMVRTGKLPSNDAFRRAALSFLTTAQKQKL